MGEHPHVAAFRSLPTAHLPDVHALDARLQVFWVLTAAKADTGIETLGSSQVSDILRDVSEVVVTRQQVTAILSAAKKAGIVATSQRGGKTFFKIMKRGEDELLGVGLKPLFIEPSRALSSIRAVENIFGTLQGELKICDPYVDSRTLDYLALTEKAEKLLLLTENIQDSSRLKRDLSAFSKQHDTPIELRVAPSGHLHDRYVLHQTGMLFVGASLKDIGKKQSMIVSLPASVASEIEKTFIRNWNSASKFI